MYGDNPDGRIPDPEEVRVLQLRMNLRNEEKRLKSTPRFCRYCNTDLRITTVDEMRAGVCNNCYSRHVEYAKEKAFFRE